MDDPEATAPRFDAAPAALDASPASVLILDVPSSDAADRVLAMPAAEARLVAQPPGASPSHRLVALESIADLGDAAGYAEPTHGPHQGAELETVAAASPQRFVAAHGAAGERLVLLSEPGSAIRVNGLPTPIVSPLALGDQLVIDGGPVLHVSRRLSCEPGPAPAAVVGQSCGLCLGTFTTDSRVVVCPTCGAARHLDDEGVPESERLVCASLGACPACDAPLPESGGLAFEPED